MAVTIDAYDHLIEIMSDPTIDMSDSAADVFKLMLLTASHIRDVTRTQRSEIVSNEIPGANGYATGGQGLTGVSWAHTTGTVKWDSNNIVWTAAGGSIAAAHGVVYDTTTVTPTEALMLDIDFDGLQTAGDGTQFIVSPNTTNGWFTGVFLAG